MKKIMMFICFIISSATAECVFFSKDAVKSRFPGREEVIRTPILEL